MRFESHMTCFKRDLGKGVLISIFDEVRKMKVASNPPSAHALIKADLDHARHVMALWSDQVSKLKNALAQIDDVGNSRAALRGQRQGQQGRPPTPTAGKGAEVTARWGIKTKPPTVGFDVAKSKFVLFVMRLIRVQAPLQRDAITIVERR